MIFRIVSLLFIIHSSILSNAQNSVTVTTTGNRTITTRVIETEKACQYAFKDKHQNGIFLCGITKYPTGLDSMFFKNNITGVDFLPNVLESENRFAFFINVLKYEKKEKRYLIKLKMSPFPYKDEGFGRWTDTRCYFLKTKVGQDGKLIRDTVIFDHLE